MKYSDRFFGAIRVESDDGIKEFAAECGVSVETLRLYNDANIVPSGKDLHAITEAAGISEFELMLKMGRLDRRLTALLQTHAEQVYEVIKNGSQEHKGRHFDPVLET